MPKHAPELIIDSPYARASAGGSGSGSGGGTTPTPPPAGAYAPTPHALDSTHHSGLLSWAKVNKAGSALGDLASRPHSALTGIGPNDHHAQSHALVGGDHTAAGLTVGHTIRATGAASFAWAQLQHDDLGGITANQHHAQQHLITGADHTIAGAAFDLVGAIATNTLGLLTPTHAPGAAARILKTDGFGGLILDTTLFVVDGQTDQVTIGAGLLVADATVNKWVGINRQPNGAALDIIADKTTDITQRIKQKAGQTNRLWRIEDSAGNELIVLDSVGNLQSGRPGFYSGLTGWQITPGGNAEFNNIWARGELHASVFVKDEIHASGGTLLVATAGKLHSDAIINAAVTDNEEFQVYSSAALFPSATTDPLTIVTTSATFEGTTLFTAGVGNRIEIDDPASGPGFYFSAGEIIRVKTEIDQTNSNSNLRLADLWLEVMSATQADGYSIYSVTKRSGSDCTVPAGTGVVSYGQRGDGRILMTSDLNYAPYIDVFTTGENPWLGGAGDIIPRMRMGRLDGVGVPGVSGIPQYGMIAGSDLTNANSGYLVASNLGIRLVKVPIILNNGIANTGYWAPDGNLYVGKNVGDPANGDLQPTTTGLRVITTGSQEGNVVIGNEATDNYLRWNQAGGILQVSGSISVTDPGATVTKIYVDDQDKIYDAKADLSATGYAGQAKTQSQAYFDARRVVKVTGTWTSAAANLISWGTTAGGTNIQIFFAGNATPRTVNAGQLASTMSVRTFLFIDLGVASGNFTFIESTTLAITNVNYVLIAVCDPGTPKASVNVVAGGTYISGGNIFTNSINADRIVAGSITTDRMTAGTINADRLTAGSITTGLMTAGTINGDRITANTLNADRIVAGSITTDRMTAGTIDGDRITAGTLDANRINVNSTIAIGTNGAITGNGKTYGSAGAGFFLGYSGGPYRFDIGNSANYLRWDGTDLFIRTREAMIVTAASDDRIFRFYDKTETAIGDIRFTYTGGIATVQIPNYLRVGISGRLETPFITVYDATFNAVKEVIAFEFGTAPGTIRRRALTFNGSDEVLTYGGDFSAGGTLYGNALIVNQSFLRISVSSPPVASGNAGVAGDIRWDANYIYIYTGTVWKRATLNFW